MRDEVVDDDSVPPLAIESDPEYLALKAKLAKLRLDYYAVFYHNHYED